MSIGVANDLIHVKCLLSQAIILLLHLLVTRHHHFATFQLRSREHLICKREVDYVVSLWRVFTPHQVKGKRRSSK